MEGWVDLGYPAMHWPGTDLSIIRYPNNYTTDPPKKSIHTEYKQIGMKQTIKEIKESFIYNL